MARSRSFALVSSHSSHGASSHGAPRRSGPGFGTAAIALLLALPLALAGCDSGTQEPDAPAPEAVEYTAPESGDMAQDAADTASAAAPSGPREIPEGFKAEIPPNFPSNVPMPPGAKPVLGRGGNVGGAERTGVQLSSDQSPSEVLAYYQDEFSAGGWTLDEGMENAITATNGDKTVVLFVTPDPAGGSAVYMITEEGVAKQ